MLGQVRVPSVAVAVAARSTLHRSRSAIKASCAQPHLMRHSLLMPLPSSLLIACPQLRSPPIHTARTSPAPTHAAPDPFPLASPLHYFPRCRPAFRRRPLSSRPTTPSPCSQHTSAPLPGPLLCCCRWRCWCCTRKCRRPSGSKRRCSNMCAHLWMQKKLCLSQLHVSGTRHGRQARTNTGPSMGLCCADTQSLMLWGVWVLCSTAWAPADA